VDLLEKTGNQKQAVADLLQLAGQTTDPMTLTRVGSGLVAAGSARQASEIFKEILRGSPDSAAAHAGLGEAELAQDEFGVARTAFETAARLDPQDRVARDRSALCTRALSLDPTPANLRPIERYDRSWALLAAVVAAADACQQIKGPDQAATIERARKMVAATRRPRLLAEAVDEMTRLARDLWARNRAACGSSGDEALTRVMARLER
jgi:tetratricopeptide (TPR) repeat protein